MESHTAELVVLLGVLSTAFFTLLWRWLDSIDKTLVIVQADLKQHYGVDRLGD
jgi:hypothetical protein